jgi:hypothetical protein
MSAHQRLTASSARWLPDTLAMPFFHADAWRVVPVWRTTAPRRRVTRDAQLPWVAAALSAASGRPRRAQHSSVCGASLAMIITEMKWIGT